MSDFVPEVEEDEEIPVKSEEKQQEQAEEPFSRRFLNEKWYGKYGADGELLRFVDENWVVIEDKDEAEFLSQLWFEQEEQERKVRIFGLSWKKYKFRRKKNYTWDEEKQEWIPKEPKVGGATEEPQVNEDFIAQYQANYGVQYDDLYKKMDEEILQKTQKALEEHEEKKEKKRKKKAGEEAEKKDAWIDLGDKVHAVYVQNLPTDITEQEFIDFMSKCGVIQPDARTNKPKIKLYRDEEGNLKGDARCCYIKKESIALACSILDGANLKGHEVIVEEAHFEQKGDFDPTKKKRKLTAAQKKRYMESQNKIFEWQPEKPRNYRPPSDCCVIIKNLFTLEQMAKNAALLLDLKEEMEQSCQKYGQVKKVVVYDNHPEGVVSVSFSTTDESDMAVKYMNGRIVDGRKLTAELWDGKTKYKIKESEEDEERRRIEYEKYISGGKTEED
ncbi:unnamed protein product [Caenorhabditis angaria]|uniref:17S U2 SnRNP complex component HTATSF1 n=1 Tax=Caenorhabditis angaria TaxID=860376 RepID=A0A9P1I913_9PELO|nr:unnamed protein product [Caenorhabditis angaria]